MSSHVSLTTRDGGGRLASGAAHRSSHKPRIAPTASNGGSESSARRFAASANRASRDGAICARGAGLRVSMGSFLTCTFKGTTLGAGACCMDFAVELIASARALDREARQVRLRLRRVEHLAVEERFDAA